MLIFKVWRLKISLDSMKIITALGFLAGALTTLSFVPQVHKSWRSKRCDDLSWGMLLAFAAGVVLWLVYGLMLRAAPIIVANAVTLALLLAIILMKASYTMVLRGVSSAREGESLGVGDVKRLSQP
jgi:MtN3 and saliva related transmembrane protein